MPGLFGKYPSGIALEPGSNQYVPKYIFSYIACDIIVVQKTYTAMIVSEIAFV